MKLPDYEIEQFPTRYGTMYALSADSVIGRSLRIYGEWAEHEIDVLSRWLEDGYAIVDVGANVGTHSLAFAKRFPASQIFAIEPQPLPCAMLMASALASELQNIRTLNVGLSDETRVIGARFDYDALEGNAGAFNLQRFRTGLQEGYPLLVLPLDHIGIRSRIQLIKIDVEGMEAQVLRGAIKTLQHHRPIVFFEVLQLDALAEPRAQLLDLGYELYWLETWPFNADNFKGSKENVWSICEVGVIAFPTETRRSVTLPRVTGEEQEIPHNLNPLLGYHDKSKVNSGS